MKVTTHKTRVCLCDVQKAERLERSDRSQNSGSPFYLRWGKSKREAGGGNQVIDNILYHGIGGG